MGMILLALIVALVVVFVLGPRERVDTAIRFEPGDLGDDPVAALAASEAAFGDIRDGLQKEIIWRDPATRRKTSLSIVYIHGFSASKPEVRPLPDRIADALDANIFYTRLTGHGRSSDAMAEATAQDWLDDTAEAIEIGRRIGDRVIVISTSTGGTAAAFAAQHPDLSHDIAAMVFLSPNFGVQAAGSEYLTMPWGRTIVPMILGQERSFATDNDAYNHGWTTRYPMVALLPMMALVQHVRDLPFERATMPALFAHAPDDQVVNPDKTRPILARWGGPTEWIDVPGTRGPSHHVIAGDIVNPEMTDELVSVVLEWLHAKGLQSAG